MALDFSAIECGFDNGMGGASNAAGSNDYHYVLFGRDGDGVYFEYDDQIHGDIDLVTAITFSVDLATFCLVDGDIITVRCSMDSAKWAEFLDGLRNVFDQRIVTEL